MAVYTEVSEEELDAFLAGYGIGGLLACKGIAEGVENSNYLLHTEAGFFILTLYERRVDPDELPFFLGLMEHLSQRGITCPTPVKMRSGDTLGRLAGRPAAIVTFLDGMALKRPGVRHCRSLGAALAEMHRAGRDFAMARVNALAVHGWRPLMESSLPRADEVLDGLGAEIESALDVLEAAWPRGLPAGVIHADLFPDNVFFLGDEVSGLIDFYFACNDFLAYDVAVCLNSWCFEADGAFNVTKARALLSGYAEVRPFEPGELDALPLLARGAALRFLLTRLYDWLSVPEGALVTPKDPLEYLRKLRFHRGVESIAAYGLDPQEHA